MYAVPEIEQGLTDAAGSKVTVSFTPHLIPMVGSALSCDIFSCFLSKITKFYFAIYQSRGMQSTIYVEMAQGVRTEDLHRQLKLSYQV